MTDRIALAAHNNALWCDAVCRAHGLTGVLDDVAWTSPRRTPPYYPDAVTLSPEASEYDILARIDPGDGASVKDSWSRLDLTAEDFARLVVGEWLWWTPAALAGTPPRVGGAQADGREWRRVTTPDDMAGWTRAWSADPADAGILRPALLDQPGVHLLAASGDGDGVVTAGCAVNVTDGVAGLSNTFSVDGDEERTWRGAVTAAHHLVGVMPVVSWDAGAGVEAAVSAGAERLGPLTVWIS
ncbi:hypothetical protein [Intrasporangium sp. DVR]|uniref:hypothetical protein n=1 Tax=Intrasporangium sp. DVR TaxID=3127867 RepID=UPI003341C2DC